MAGMAPSIDVVLAGLSGALLAAATLLAVRAAWRAAHR